MSNTVQIVIVILLFSFHFSLFGFHVIARLSELQESIENCQYLQLQDECDRCEARESENWTHATGRRVRFEECCWDLFEVQSGSKYEREVMEEHCWEQSGDRDD